MTASSRIERFVVLLDRALQELSASIPGMLMDLCRVNSTNLDREDTNSNKSIARRRKNGHFMCEHRASIISEASCKDELEFCNGNDNGNAKISAEDGDDNKSDDLTAAECNAANATDVVVEETNR